MSTVYGIAYLKERDDNDLIFNLQLSKYRKDNYKLLSDFILVGYYVLTSITIAASHCRQLALLSHYVHYVTAICNQCELSSHCL